MKLALIVVVCCVGMLGCDLFSTLLVVAEARGRENLAGLSDIGADFWGKTVLTAYGLTDLTHGHGWLGWVLTLPVFATGFLTTKYTTRYSRRIKEAAGEGT